MHHYINLLSDLSYQLGIIGIYEYEERLKIASWLSSTAEEHPDPRNSQLNKSNNTHENQRSKEEIPQHPQENFNPIITDKYDQSDQSLQFLAFRKWIFTLGDADCYPSVPHGHLLRKTSAWPKLNPYIGRAFSDIHVEDVSHRLTRGEMKILWNDDGFLEHCRKQVLWYSDFSRDYKFPNARFGKLRFPKYL